MHRESGCSSNLILHTTILILANTFVQSTTSAADSSNGESYWQQFVHYKMEVSLDPGTHVLTGTSEILYRNNSPDTLDRIYMHLYPNGFRDNNTIRAQEARRFYVENLPDEKAAGWIRIDEFRIRSKSQSSGEEEVSAFEIDDTILKASLPEPLAPGDELQLELIFTEKVRPFQDRSGYRGDQYDMAQWYPKMCVYDEDGWQAEPFHYVGEFYGEFGTFDVSIIVPFDYIVAATGVVTAGDPGWSLVAVDTALSYTEWRKQLVKQRVAILEQAEDTKSRSVTFHAEDVHDFAWVACPDFVYERGEYDGIPIHVLYRSYAKSRWSNVVAERGRRALKWLSNKFGRYPYPQLTITHGLLGGGMEYPMLVMNSSSSESLILHEVGHIYFYGIFGNNEQKEAWLDEGFTTFQTRWYMETRYGTWGFDYDERMRDATWLGRRRPQLTSNQANRNSALEYMSSGFDEPISHYAYRYRDDAAYGRNAYTKGSIFYEMLRYVTGDSVFEQICMEYFNRWALKHVNEARFRQVCEEVSGMDLGWFFEQWLHQTNEIDYALGKLKKSQDSQGNWETVVKVKRRGEGIMPVEVELKTEDGARSIQRWDGRDREGTVTFSTASKPSQVVLDPRDQVLDRNRFGHGDMHIEVYPHYPNIESYRPANTYVVTWKPSVWYNDVDGVRLGLRLRGQHRGTRSTELSGWVGTESGQMDGLARFSNSLGWLRPNASYGLSAMRLEGRFLADAHLSKSIRRRFGTPPQLNITTGFSFDELPADHLSYGRTRIEIGDRIETIANWSAGKVGQVYLAFDVDPRGLKWGSWLRGRIAHANEALASDFSFTRAEGEFLFWRPILGLVFSSRWFGGGFLRHSDEKPLQDLFYAFGATPREQFEHFYLRSPGALPAELHYHAPGGGNLRGYYDQPDLRGTSLFAFNLELNRRIKFPWIDGLFISRLLGSSTIAAFLDAGHLSSLYESEGVDLADAGLGMLFHKRVPDAWYSFVIGTEYTIRLDFPVWVSQPRVRTDGRREDELALRYVMSFRRAI